MRTECHAHMRSSYIKSTHSMGDSELAENIVHPLEASLVFEMRAFENHVLRATRVTVAFGLKGSICKNVVVNSDG